MKTLANELKKNRSAFKCSNVTTSRDNEGSETENRSVGGSIPPLGTIIPHVTVAGNLSANFGDSALIGDKANAAVDGVIPERQLNALSPKFHLLRVVKGRRFAP
ncbi:hypothetical protein CI1B_48880 [Bradyrhizobium ivorense]|uniref:Uncharacterized protein n=1 Tax=Bradyrhizobium ivorense TaxID=2511166 RepID=A0A508TDZ5_9BRAD|nr:hypothetical protein [Bradyrhizobium ivorense]VIO73283.1 hypothetical protein CI1B_48880 [Bradyrhizobium ivorense]